MSGREAPKGTDHKVLQDYIQGITKPVIHRQAHCRAGDGGEAHLGAEL